MKVSALSSYSPKFGKTNENGYENPINRNTERNLKILSTAGVGLLAGVTAFGIATTFIGEAVKNRYMKAGAIGAVFTAITTLLLLPTALYNTKVKAFTREKEMDVFSVKRDTQSNIFDEVNQQVKNKDVPLSEKVGNFAKVSMATNGNGVMIAGA